MTKQPWTDADNERRLDLIAKETKAPLTCREFYELDCLTERGREYRKEVAPLPIKEAKAAFKEAKAAFKEAKASAAEKERADFEASELYREVQPGVERGCAWEAWLARAALDRGRDFPGETERECFEAEAEEHRLTKAEEEIAWLFWSARAAIDRGDLPVMMELPEGVTP